MRITVAVIMNAFVAGTGLMLLGQPWLGLALAVWFAIGLELALCGTLIAPAVVLPGATYAAAVFAAVAWGIGQGLLVKRYRFLQAPNLHEELAMLRSHAASALAEREFKTALADLAIVLSVDSDDLEARVLSARILSKTANRRKMVRAWRHVADLDVDGQFADEISAGLAASQSD